MTKLHISLVGGQPMPSYLGIIDDNPDETILIYSSKSERQANIITKTIQKNFGKMCKKVKFNAFNIGNIKSQIKELDRDIAQYDHITINLSSGSKPWSILFYEYFKEKRNIDCLYIDQNNNVWNLENNNCHKIEYVPSFIEIFSLNETKIKSHIDFNIYTNEDFEAIEQIKQVRKKNYRAFNEILSRFANNPNSSYQEYQNDYSSIEWHSDTKTYHCEIEDRNRKMYVKDITSPNIRNLMLSTGWFELEVAQYLSQWTLAKEIWLNCEFTTTQSVSQDTKNEIDIIINTGEKLLFVECKTQVYQITDIDKFNNAVRTYGGLSAKRLFITDDQMETKAAEKCSNYEMLFYSLKELKKSTEKAQEFFEHLSAEMNESNKK